MSYVTDEMEKGSDFDLLLLHMLGMDAAGHTHGSKHPEIQRKLLDTEKFIKWIIEKMDNETTLVVYGDHGMTVEGSHGGNSNLEMGTTIFAYQKKPFPFAQKWRKFKQEFENMDRSMKQVDLASIASLLTKLPVPFSNLGIMHPAFAQTSDMD